MQRRVVAFPFWVLVGCAAACGGPTTPFTPCPPPGIAARPSLTFPEQSRGSSSDWSRQVAPDENNESWERVVFRVNDVAGNEIIDFSAIETDDISLRDIGDGADRVVYRTVLSDELRAVELKFDNGDAVQFVGGVPVEGPDLIISGTRELTGDCYTGTRRLVHCHAVLQNGDARAQGYRGTVQYADAVWDLALLWALRIPGDTEFGPCEVGALATRRGPR